MLFSVEVTWIFSVKGALPFSCIVDRDMSFNPKSSALLSVVAKARGKNLLALVHVMRIQLVTVAFAAMSLGFTLLFAVEKRAIINLKTGLKISVIKNQWSTFQFCCSFCCEAFHRAVSFPKTFYAKYKWLNNRPRSTERIVNIFLKYLTI